MPHRNGRLIAINAADAPPRTKASNYPAPFAQRMQQRVKQPLGDLFGLTNFGVNLTRIAPGGVSALHHRHSAQDEFVYVLEGDLVLVTDEGQTMLKAGMCAGFPKGGTAHHLRNMSDRDAVILEIGDRTPGDEVGYPADDIAARLDKEGRWVFTHKDGEAY